MNIEEYIGSNGSMPFTEWFCSLDEFAASKINKALYRLREGNFSNVKGLGGGVLEYKINVGPGYRIYFGMKNNELIILLIGGTKKRQHNDVKLAKQMWKIFKKLKS